LVFAAYFFALCVAIAVIVSMFYPAPSAAQLSGLTFGTVTDKQKDENKASYNIWDIVASVMVVIIVVYIMISFSTLSL
jgi:SSS family solute:Na+ symporter